ncbi:DNA mismatch repair endonuclease MutL [Enterocloster citroniae]|uniref:DNA mismatch repair endonuclease MutL n=1 Tax=Enterocloster citroniae TaxID=358743 RepID=UPI001D0733CE|nr:DNA mismatch repair endonuclease MutL [Enterocloster citroniae]MCB7063778.1 DNA mismatch repair endonuclease MutL [Enterocloster citroniae]
MANITVLDQSTINKIAAGEVIERPASVVKELLENAIDAQATAVTIEIKDGGCSMVRVTDNGCGIPRDQIALAFLRHATSKIRSVEDLFTVSSLGFRGEALASIAAVAQVELISKTSDSLTGSRYQIEGGAERGLEEIGAPEGTTIIARNLFYNTPARKKFLKTPMTEGAHVAAVVEKIALSHPDISIRFIQNNQNKLYTSGNHNLKDLIYTVFGREITSNLLAVNAQEGDIQVSGFIGKPVIARSNRNYENYFINGRYIRSSVISKAIEEAYKPFMMQHKYPFTMLHFTIQQDTLDVNVHPTKMELRFSDGEAVYRAVVKAVADALAHKELIPEVSLAEKKEKEPADLAQRLSPRPEPFEVKRRESMNRAAQPAAQDKASSSASYARTPPPKPSYVNELMPEWLKVRKREQEAAANAMKDSNATQNTASTFSEKLQDINKTDSTSNKYIGDKQDQVPTLAEDQSNAPAPKEPEQLDLFDGKLLDPKARLRHKLIGQLFDTYWMVEYNEQLFIIDQHAAHEKVLYEKTIKTLKTRQYDTQMVEPPIILTLNMNEEVLLSRYMSYFTGMGFEIEPFGGREYAVRGVPANLFSIAQKELLIEMIDGLSDDISVHNPDIIYERVASMSCKAAVKGHHSLSAAEANELIDQLLQLDNPYACPHGRPTIISMTKYELEKKFKRIV